jgi:hypothetical protein
VLTQLGVQQVFHNIAQRPGKPMWFGIGPQGQAVFGLPGNPVSTLVCLIRYVIPGDRRSDGHAPHGAGAPGAGGAGDVPAAARLLPAGHRRTRRLGPPLGQSAAANGSGDFLSLAGTDGFVELPPGPNTYAKGLRHQHVSLVTGAMEFNVHDIRGAKNPLDRRGRPLHDLRISVMDRCNFRCPYCMPKEQFHEHYRFLKSQERCRSRRSCASRGSFAASACASCASPAANRCCAPISPIWSAI